MGERRSVSAKGSNGPGNSASIVGNDTPLDGSERTLPTFDPTGDSMMPTKVTALDNSKPGRSRDHGSTAKRAGTTHLTSESALPRLLSIDEVADHLGITPRHIRRLVAERRIPYVKVGRFVRFDPSSVMSWLDGARREPGDVWDGVPRRHSR